MTPHSWLINAKHVCFASLSKTETPERDGSNVHPSARKASHLDQRFSAWDSFLPFLPETSGTIWTHPGIHGLSQLGTEVCPIGGLQPPYSKDPSFPNIGSAKLRHYYSSLDSLVQQECRRNISLMESWGCEGHVHCLLCLDFLSPFGHFSFPSPSLLFLPPTFFKGWSWSCGSHLQAQRVTEAWECPPPGQPWAGVGNPALLPHMRRDLKFTIWSAHRIWLRMRLASLALSSSPLSLQGLRGNGFWTTRVYMLSCFSHVWCFAALWTM